MWYVLTRLIQICCSWRYVFEFLISAWKFTWSEEASRTPYIRKIFTFCLITGWNIKLVQVLVWKFTYPRVSNFMYRRSERTSRTPYICKIFTFCLITGWNIKLIQVLVWKFTYPRVAKNFMYRRSERTSRKYPFHRKFNFPSFNRFKRFLQEVDMHHRHKELVG